MATHTEGIRSLRKLAAANVSAVRKGECDALVAVGNLNFHGGYLLGKGKGWPGIRDTLALGERLIRAVRPVSP